MSEQNNVGQEFANLDLLRSVAVLSVFFSHLHDIATHRGGEVAWRFGQMGVLIFFVHTTLVLMKSMDRLAINGRALYSTFYIRRWFRIYPLSIFCVLSVYAFNVGPGIDQVARNWTLKELLANLSLTQDLFYKDSMVGGLWTLPLEVQMYVALPILFVIFRNRSLAWPFALWVATIPLALVQPRISGRLDVVGFVPCFLGGILAWRISQMAKPKLPGWLWPLGFVAVCPVWMVSSRQYNMLYRWAFCLVLGCTIPWFRQINWAWLKTPAKLVARYSYGIYLSHVALMMLCFRGLPWQSRAGVWLAFTALAVGTPIAMYHLMEHPMIARGCREGFRRCSLGGTQPFHARSGGTVLPICRYRADRTWTRRYDLRDGILDEGRKILRKLPASFKRRIRAVLGKN
jgi:peptidoglycan/LPS O-acetylase OafA/YrhL